MPTGHVLGLGSASDIAPKIFMNAGNSIVESMRETGKQVAANVEKIQTNRQVKAMGAELSTLDPATPGFTQSLLGVATKYPMALKDERGQAIIGMLGNANKQYIAQQMDLQNFGQAKELAGLQHGYRMDEIGQRGQSQTNRYKNVPGVGLVDTLNEEVVFGSPEKMTSQPEGTALYGAGGRLVAPARDRTTATPFSISGGNVLNRTNGTFEALPQQPMTQYQQGMLDARGAQAESSRLTGKINGLNTEYKNLTTELDKTQSEDRKNYINGRLQAIWNETDATRRELNKLEGASQVPSPQNQSLLGGMNPAPLPPPQEVPLVPDALVAPQTKSQVPIQPAPQKFDAQYFLKKGNLQ